MPVPLNLSDLSTTASSNSPQGTESAKGTIDDYLRSHGAFIAQLNALVAGSTVTLASAATVGIGAANSINVSITGTTAITAFDTAAEGVARWVVFAGALTLTHSAASLQLPGAANIATAAGDAALFKSLGGGNWKCLDYQRVNGLGVVSASSTKDGYLTSTDWNTFNGKQAAGQCLPLAGGTMAGHIHMANNAGIFAKDTTGYEHDLLIVAADNNTYLTNVGGKTLYFNSKAGAQVAALSNTGDFSAATITQTSDERKKKQWQRLPGDFLTRLAGVKKSGLFIWKKGGALGVGVGAQSLEAFLPVAVHTDERGNKTVNYGAAAMVAAVELARAVVDLQARVAELEAR